MTQAIPGSMRALAEPQLSLVSILRPYAGFENVYNGISGTTPIMFTEKGRALDEQAGSVGYSKRLLAALKVPLGARMMLWMPIAVSQLAFGPYNWVVIWRLRNTHDYREQRVSYHYPKQGQGTPATTVGDAGPRVVLPCALQTAAVTTPGPRAGLVTSLANAEFAADYAYQRLFVEAIQPQATLYSLTPGTVTPIKPPLLDALGTTGVMQQGVMNDVGVPVDLGMPTSLLFDTVCQGDEMMLGCLKEQTPLDRPGWTANWSFVNDGSDDSTFSFMFGQGKIDPASQTPKPDIGVYVMVGVTQ